MKKLMNVLLLLIASIPMMAQAVLNNEADKLLAEATPIRENFNVTHYALSVEVMPNTKAIKGTNIISFEAVEDIKEIQIDLFDNMQVSAVTAGNTALKYNRKHHAIFITLNKPLKKGEAGEVTVAFNGQPIEAKNPPWDGGFVWKQDDNGKPFVGVSVEGLGASSWWPNKDLLNDEPENGVEVNVTVPKDLVGVSNGKLVGEEENANSTTYKWKTTHSVDNYNVTLYVGDYVDYTEYYEGIPDRDSQGMFVAQNGRSLPVNFYVLKDHLEKAKEHFTFTQDVLQTLEIVYGPYPFYEDGFKIVEAPYLGMEHQSAIAYGNGFQNGYDGELIQPYLEWDYLFVHEAAHEWWGNNVSMASRSDLWIQEAFATYSDAFYAYSMFGGAGYERMMEYFKTRINNKKPMVGKWNEDFGDIDVYYKGAVMLSTLSQLVEDNQKWFAALQKAQVEFAAPKTITTDEFIEFLEKEFKMELTPFFNQYLYTTKIPKLIVRIRNDEGKKFAIYKWENVVEGFEMPVKIQTKQYGSQWIYPTEKWKKVELPRDYEEKFLDIDNAVWLYDVDFKK